MKWIKDFKLFEELDAFSRVGDKGWVVLVGDERFEYFRRWLPEEVTSSEMLRLEGLFSKFNNRETSIDKEIPSDDGYKVNTGAFSVRFNLGYYAVPFNFYKRSDDWWLFWCKCRCNWVNVCNDVEWNRETTLNGGSIILCDSVEGIEEFLNDYSGNLISENTDNGIFKEMMESRKDYYQQISNVSWGEDARNRISVTDMFVRVEEMIRRKLSENKIVNHISEIKKSQRDYRIIVTVNLFINKRRFPGGLTYDFGIDILDDEWFLVHLNQDGIGNYIFFKCDQFEGLEKFIDDLTRIVLYYRD